MTELIEDLRAALDQAQTMAWDVREVHRITNPEHERFGEIAWPRASAAAVYQNSSQVLWGSTLSFFEAWSPDRVLRLIASHRQLLDEYAKSRSENEGIRWSLVGESRCLALHGEVRRVAEFWLGSTE